MRISRRRVQAIDPAACTRLRRFPQRTRLSAAELRYKRLLSNTDSWPRLQTQAASDSSTLISEVSVTSSGCADVATGTDTRASSENSPRARTDVALLRITLLAEREGMSQAWTARVSRLATARRRDHGSCRHRRIPIAGVIPPDDVGNVKGRIAGIQVFVQPAHEFVLFRGVDIQHDIRAPKGRRARKPC